MEKKSNLPNADDLCVEYVLNELDPSEAVMVERAMESDLNLLIEIECLRRTLKKLEDLPHRSPPADIRDAIVHQAVNHYHENRRSLFPKWNNTTAMATAAAVVFSVMFSIVNFYPDEVTNPEASSPGSKVQEVKAVTPWVDHNDVLHINQASTNSERITAGSSDLQHSLQRLRLIEQSSPFPLTPDTREIHLTRTSN